MVCRAARLVVAKSVHKLLSEHITGNVGMVGTAAFGIDSTG